MNLYSGSKDSAVQVIFKNSESIVKEGYLYWLTVFKKISYREYGLYKESVT